MREKSGDRTFSVTGNGNRVSGVNLGDVENALGYKSQGPRVFVVQENPRLNLLPALDYGSAETLLSAGDSPVLSPGPVSERMWGRLYQFTDADYILPVGCPAAIGLACALAAAANNGRYKILKWDNQERRYFVGQFDLTTVVRQ